MDYIVVVLVLIVYLIGSIYSVSLIRNSKKVFCNRKKSWLYIIYVIVIAIKKKGSGNYGNQNYS